MYKVYSSEERKEFHRGYDQSQRDFNSMNRWDYKSGLKAVDSLLYYKRNDKNAVSYYKGYKYFARLNGIKR